MRELEPHGDSRELAVVKEQLDNMKGAPAEIVAGADRATKYLLTFTNNLEAAFKIAGKNPNAGFSAQQHPAATAQP